MTKITGLHHRLCLLAMTLLPSSAFAIETAAKQALMIDAKTHSVLLEKSADETMHPSSMSKLMTVYILFDHLKNGSIKLSDTLKVSEKAWRMEGSKMFVRVGDDVSVEDLMHGIITQSGNDACVVVAEGLGGSEEAFAEEMNKTAQKLGLSHSHFTNATGWPDDNHLMSARDLAILAERIIEDFPEYYQYFSLPEFTYNKIRQPNRNRLLGKIGVDGLKTGHTEIGGFGIVLSALQDNRRLILVVNGLDSDNARVDEGDKLLRYGFREFTNKVVAKKGAILAEAKTWLGKPKNVPLTVADDLEITLPVAAQSDVKFTLKYNGPLPTPIAAGDHVADLVITANGLSQTVPLIAAKNVGSRWGLGRLIALIHYYISGH